MKKKMSRGKSLGFEEKPEFRKLAEQRMSPLELALARHCITVDSLAQQLAAELAATETKAFKSRGEPVEYSKPLRNWNVQQRAREDAQKLLGLYPAEEHRLTAEVSEGMSEEDKAILRAVATEIANKVKGKNVK